MLPTSFSDVVGAKPSVKTPREESDLIECGVFCHGKHATTKAKKGNLATRMECTIVTRRKAELTIRHVVLITIDPLLTPLVARVTTSYCGCSREVGDNTRLRRRGESIL